MVRRFPHGGRCVMRFAEHQTNPLRTAAGSNALQHRAPVSLVTLVAVVSDPFGAITDHAQDIKSLADRRGSPDT